MGLPISLSWRTLVQACSQDQFGAVGTPKKWTIGQKKVDFLNLTPFKLSFTNPKSWPILWLKVNLFWQIWGFASHTLPAFPFPHPWLCTCACWCDWEATRILAWKLSACTIFLYSLLHWLIGCEHGTYAHSGFKPGTFIQYL